MNQNLIFIPVFALVALTFFVALRFGRLRFFAVSEGHLSLGYYAFNRGENPPDYLAKFSHNYDNLLALPMLFYVVIGGLVMTNTVTWLQLLLAVGFVFSRLIHSLIHLGTNNIVLRGRAFIAGVIFLMVMWIAFAISLFSAISIH